MNKSFKVLLVGAGQLGSRHLQGLCRSQFQLEIEVVEPNESARTIARERANEVLLGASNKTIKFLNLLDEASESPDFVVVSTNANVRLAVIKKILLEKKPKRILLEKFLFNKMNEYDELTALLKINPAKVWVNCARRSWGAYQELKSSIEALKIGDVLEMNVRGAKWGLACNVIHYIDLFAFLSGNDDLSIVHREFSSPYPAKREGYFEVTGFVCLKNGQGATCFINCTESGEVPSTIEVVTTTGSWLIFEEAGRIVKRASTDSYRLTENTFKIEYQSGLTGKVLDEILTSGTSKLTSYNSSAKMHKMVLAEFLKHYSFFDLVKDGACPIT